MGVGTEKVESELAHFLPKARIARMDADATSAKGSHDRILGDFKKRKIDILVGTQMIAKGFDFPEVTLVRGSERGRYSEYSDFRSAERTFGLITQVAGRSAEGMTADWS
jgi:primosomal protein N' (replication factor Y)